MDYYPSDTILAEARKRRDYRALDILGQRIHFMVYPKSNYSKNGPLIIPMIFSEAGRNSAKAIRKMIPECSYPLVGRKIELYDYENSEDVFNQNEITILSDGFFVGIREIDFKTIAVCIAEFV